ncbi:MAG: hypothetical protein KBC30_02535 [Planctomycetes bacterium]|nr:hypothetical protein [Planctomycetota bacterium]
MKKTEAYPVFIQKWFPGIGATNLIGDWKDKSMLRWVLEKTMSWNNITFPEEGYYRQCLTYDDTYRLLGWMTLEGKEEFGRSYQEIRAVLLDDNVELSEEEIRILLFQLPVTRESKPSDLVLLLPVKAKEVEEEKQVEKKPKIQVNVVMPQTSISLHSTQQEHKKRNFLYPLIGGISFLIFCFLLFINFQTSEKPISETISEEKIEKLNEQIKQQPIKEEFTEQGENIENQLSKNDNIQKNGVDESETSENTDNKVFNVRNTYLVQIDVPKNMPIDIIIGSTTFDMIRTKAFRPGRYNVFIELKKSNYYFEKIEWNKKVLQENYMRTIFEQDLEIQKDSILKITIGLQHKIFPSPEAGQIQWDTQGIVRAIPNDNWKFMRWEDYSQQNPRQIYGREGIITAYFQKQEVSLQIQAPENVFQLLQINGKNVPINEPILLKLDKTYTMSGTWDHEKWRWVAPVSMVGNNAKWQISNRQLDTEFFLQENETWNFDFLLAADCQVNLKNAGEIVYNSQSVDGGKQYFPRQAKIIARPINPRYSFQEWRIEKNNQISTHYEPELVLQEPLEKVEAIFKERIEYIDWQNWKYKEDQVKRQAELLEEWLSLWTQYKEFLQENEIIRYQIYEEKLHQYNEKKQILEQDFQPQTEYSQDVWTRWEQEYQEYCDIQIHMQFQIFLTTSQKIQLENISEFLNQKITLQNMEFTIPLSTFFQYFNIRENQIILQINKNTSILWREPYYVLTIGSSNNIYIEKITYQLQTGKQEILKKFWQNIQ